MRTMGLFSLCFLIISCHSGDFREQCNKDGSCNGKNLKCIDGWCELKPPSVESDNCIYESDCFCKTCANKCGDAGFKNCKYSDTSVWGSEPAVCECK